MVLLSSRSTNFVRLRRVCTTITHETAVCGGHGDDQVFEGEESWLQYQRNFANVMILKSRAKLGRASNCDKTCDDPEQADRS